MCNYLFFLPLYFLLTGLIIGVSSKNSVLFSWLSKLAVYGAGLLLIAYLFLLPSTVSWSYTILDYFNLKLTLKIIFDHFSRVMVVVIVIISSTILAYSQRYLKSDVTQARFLAQIHMVIASVLLLVMAGNLLTAFIAWQFIGLTLYILLNHYHFDIYANKAAKKKFIVNRVGDLCFLIAIIIVFQQTNNSDFIYLVTLHHNNLIALFILIAVMTKSAQFPFHIWLPDTLEAPTPVSALMHAGVINAGGILIIRCSNLFLVNHSVLVIMCFIGTLTALIGNINMNHQVTIKKRLAYSTMAQMGYMILQCGFGLFSAALFHLISHGFLKGYLFLNTGSALTIDRNTTDNKFKPILGSILLSMLLIFIVFIMTHSINTSIPILFWGFIVIAVWQYIHTVFIQHCYFGYKLFAIALIILLLIIYLSVLHKLSIWLMLDGAWLNINWLQYIITGILIVAQLLFMLNDNNKHKKLFSFNHTVESLCRMIFLNNLRKIGDILNYFLYNKKNIHLILGAMTLLLCLHVLLYHQDFTLYYNIIFTELFSLLLLFLVVANRSLTIKQVMFWLSMFQIVLFLIMLMFGNKVIHCVAMYYMLNVILLILTLFFVISDENILEDDESSINNKNKLSWPMFYLSVGLLLLIGIPGTASFIGEVYIFSFLLKENILFFIAYALTMFMLAVVIMHALQIYVFHINNGSNLKHRITPMVHVFFLLAVSLNVFFGIFPQIGLKLAGALL